MGWTWGTSIDNDWDVYSEHDTYLNENGHKYPVNNLSNLEKSENFSNKLKQLTVIFTYVSHLVQTDVDECMS